MLSTVAYFLLAILATINITEIIVYEKIFQPIRELFGHVHSDNGTLLAVGDSYIGKLLSCFRCTSVWTGTFVAGVFFFYPPALLVLSLPYIAFKVWTAISWVEWFINNHFDP